MKLQLTALLFLVAITNCVYGQTTYTGLFSAPDGQGMHTDNWLNLRPNSGATAANSWNIYHQDGSSLFSLLFASANPSIQVGNSRPTNFYVNGNVGIGTTSTSVPLEVAQSGTAIFRNQPYSTSGFIPGAVNIFRSNPDASSVNTLLNLTNYWNSLSQKTSILAIDFRSGDGSGGSYGGSSGPAGRIKVQTAWEATPYMDFDLNGITAMRLQNGNMGIGTTSPGAKLDVGAFLNGGTLGTVLGRLAEGNSSGGGTFLGVKGYDTQPVDAKSFALEHSFYGSINSSINFVRGGSVTGGYLTFNTNDNSEKMRIHSNGNVGIGTTSPDAKLAVNGQIHATEVKVTTTVPGPDYVFEPSYHLSPLDSVKTYIDKNKHLPEVPSAKEMEKNGVNLGEMNMLLLKKIEELTLYVIELKKDNDNQKDRNDLQQKQIDQLRDKK